jgi:hypothetical protein
MKKIKIFYLLLIILVLNLIWEFSHYQLYNDLTNIPGNIHLIIASFADVALVSSIFILVSLFNKNIKWIEKTKTKDYILIVIFGILIAAILEIINLNLGRWAYKAAMPTIFNIGLSPLTQLFTTGIISLIIHKNLFK